MKHSLYILLLAFAPSIKVFCQTEIEKELFSEKRLSNEEMADFKDKALRKTQSLANYIGVISNKDKEELQRTKAIELAVKLFMSEENSVEVSSLNSDQIRKFKIRAYLNKLKVLPYYTVKMKWYNLFFASNFVLRPDGRYEAVATIYQQFDGTTNDGGKYMDITKKSIQIIIEPKEIKAGDQVTQAWEIFLGDIRVLETKKA